MDVKVLLGCFSLFVASAVYADSCPQETSYTVDARQNCLGAPWGKSNGTPAKFFVSPGKYLVYLGANNMSCMNNDLSNGCNIDTVLIHGGMMTARWGRSISGPTQIEVSDSSGSFVAYVADDNCGDNTGSAKLIFQKLN